MNHCWAGACSVPPKKQQRIYYSGDHKHHQLLKGLTGFSFPFCTCDSDSNCFSWLNLKGQEQADVALHPPPTSRVWCPKGIWSGGGGGGNKQNITVPPSTCSLSLLMPLLLRVASVQTDSPAHIWAFDVPVCGSPDRPGVRHWYVILSQLPVESTSQSGSAPAQHKQCFPGWSQSNK